MATLKEPIDVGEYARIYKQRGEIAADKVLTSFRQTATSYVAVWQNDQVMIRLEGDPKKLRAWLAAP
jgi:hypothetical protein